LIYDNTGTKIINYFQHEQGSTYTTPANAYYIALSLQPGLEAADIDIRPTSNVLKSSSNSSNEIKTNSPEYSYDISNSGDFRLFFSGRLKIDLNSSNQIIPLCTLTNSGQSFSIDAISRPATAYS
jgi:hypothetical protein